MVLLREYRSNRLCHPEATMTRVTAYCIFGVGELLHASKGVPQFATAEFAHNNSTPTCAACKPPHRRAVLSDRCCSGLRGTCELRLLLIHRSHFAQPRSPNLDFSERRPRGACRPAAHDAEIAIMIDAIRCDPSAGYPTTPSSPASSDP
jgi:hypothetical protein